MKQAYALSIIFVTLILFMAYVARTSPLLH